MEKTYREEYIRRLTGGGALYDRELLAIMLSNAFGGKDMSAVADKLLGRFPSVKAILRAQLAEIKAVEGVSERVALYIYTVGRLEKYNPQVSVDEIKDIDSFAAIMTALFCDCDSENAYFYLVNRRGKVVAKKSFTSARADTVIIPTEEFLQFLSADKCVGLYFAHNHVLGSCHPSSADDEMTLRIYKLCGMRGVKFFDHIICDGHGGIFSYAKENRLSLLIEKS